MNRKITISVSFPNLKKRYGKHHVHMAKELVIEAGIKQRGQWVDVEPAALRGVININGVECPSDWIKK